MQNIRKQIVWLGVVFLLFAAPLVVPGCGEENLPADSPPAPPAGQTAAPRDGVIVAVGDSLTAGYRVAEDQAYPAILQQRLDRDGYNFDVINAGISGETSSGTLARLDWILTLKPAIIILETGANDGLRGIDPQLTRDNLDRIVARLRDAGVVVVLAGMKMIKNLGKTFTRQFESLYPAIAEKHGILLIPFFLEGVAADRQLNQADGIHPTEEGYDKVVDHVYPYVVEAIGRLK
jgi:acyl-CoA thioesterase-1